jgi:predicted NUDIX family NTP pyrophosphohydrolase
MAKTSAGILLFRRGSAGVEVLLVHPGGPFWKNKDEGAWSIPKGEFASGEDPLAAASREFEEETGVHLAPARLIALGEVKQAGGKLVRAWAAEGDLDASAIRSNTFSLEWPPKSGRSQEFPEVDRAAWFQLSEARKKLLKGQVPLLERFEKTLES